MKEDDGRIYIGYEAIVAYLEKHYKLSRLNLSKRKDFSKAMSHCNGNLLPLIIQLTENSNNKNFIDSTLSSLQNELRIFDSQIKSPYILGDTLTWVC